MASNDSGPEQTIKQELAEQEAALKAAEAAKAGAEAQAGTATARIKALKALLADLTKAASDYEGAYAELSAKDTAYREFLTNETKCLEQILGDQICEVERIVETCKEEVEAAGEAATQAAEALSKAEDELHEAETASEAAKQSVDALKAIVTTIGARHKRLEAIKKEIRAAHDVDEHSVAYWILVMQATFQGALDEQPELMAPNALPARLQAAWDAYKRTEQERVTAEAGVIAAKTKVTELTAAYEELSKNLESNIRKKLSNRDKTRNVAA